ncbi:50S ribosomal protein L4 [Maridesulfovibrio salexigens]|uniref:Large ribosomal subunit protein uL4 n=1 Tax=Maridesulfovibrio salexigens (strain ATCC 14822 / DSM 2638 / NCIMB 8403 / VKM B-1763) TaxID=526222 RepID=RL4_MARSD|nr:50S ribosomal protein L4 [Maridesulfovibrio salexigens]C6C186.1 RecName: Full=Large ribosomal subunit protein uL4; AltName: Full=50S ribosomal protein L4 [Maridesulfovibrio salexigens DSM 2638]ACS79249.1 ribosomal protein L4/L1e [Maridesulfovibrio salexigens DSM 2638]
MATITIYDQTKKEVGSMDLAPEVFEVPVKPEILHLVVRSQLAAKRQGTHATKTRGMKRGGGAKPWRQKGTGRARAGSTRSPLWRGGGTTFGPQPRDYSFKVNKKVRRLALKMALTSRLSEEKMMVVKNIDLPEIKTKLFVEVAEALGLEKALVVVKDADNKLLLSARNIPGIKLITADQLNVYDILKARQLVMLENAAQDLQERLK